MRQPDEVTMYRQGVQDGARVMRERAADRIEDEFPGFDAETIRALPVGTTEITDDLGRLVGIDPGDVNPADMVEPGDEVPTLCELEARITDLETQLGDVCDKVIALTGEAERP